MKSTNFWFASFVALALASCSAGDSPILKQARTMQESIMKECNGLDSTLGIKITDYEARLTEMSNDTLLNSDSTKLSAYKILKERYNELLDTKTRMDNWKANLTLIPTPEEIANGAENPFGKDSKDEDVLTKMKSANADFAKLKSDVLAILE